jgi:hypothetical protein
MKSLRVSYPALKGEVFSNKTINLEKLSLILIRIAHEGQPINIGT